MVGGIWKVLRLQTETIALLVDVTGLAGNRAVEKVPGVKLYSRLSGRHIKRSAGLRFHKPHRVHQALALPVEHEIVVVPVSVVELLIIRTEAAADRRGPPEVERGAGDRSQLSRRDQRLVNRREPTGIARQLV